MIEIIRAKDRHFADHGWLKANWLFSFGDYFDEDNVQFGALRVYNDDVVAAGEGFPPHPHREMEIVTLVFEGELTHQDSMGTKATVRPGEVQTMSAGTGITHSEFNLGTKPVHLHQIWLVPGTSRLKPSYDQKRFQPNEWENRLFPVASGQNIPDAAVIHTDATIYRASLDAGHSINFDRTKGRRIFVYLVNGSLEVNGQVVQANDQARADIDVPLVLKAKADAEFILIDVAA